MHQIVKQNQKMITGKKAHHVTSAAIPDMYLKLQAVNLRNFKDKI